MKLSEIEVDVQREDEGEWRDLALLPGVRAHLKSAHNPDYRRCLAHKLRRLQRKGGARTIDPLAIEKATNEAILEKLLTDVEGVTDDQGMPIAYSPELGKEWMLKRKYRRFQQAIQAEVDEVGLDELEELEDDLGESEGLSATDS